MHSSELTSFVLVDIPSVSILGTTGPALGGYSGIGGVSAYIGGNTNATKKKHLNGTTNSTCYFQYSFVVFYQRLFTYI